MELKDAGIALLDALTRFFAVMPTWMLVLVVFVIAVVFGVLVGVGVARGRGGPRGREAPATPAAPVRKIVTAVLFLRMVLRNTSCTFWLFSVGMVGTLSGSWFAGLVRNCSIMPSQMRNVTPEVI